MSPDRRPVPSLLTSVPIRNTRAGLHFTCAAPTVAASISSSSCSRDGGTRDLWVCSSDGYFGQLCVLNLVSEPNVTACNGICRSRILCICAVPGSSAGSSSDSEDEAEEGDIGTDPDTSSETDSNSDENEQVSERDCGSPVSSVTKSFDFALPVRLGGATAGMMVRIKEISRPTMWIGMEDGCIHIYRDNIRFERNIRIIPHSAAVHCIIYLENRVFVALANGKLVVYTREQEGSWSTANPVIVTVGTVAAPITKMVPVTNRIWCTCQHTVKILNISTLQIEHTLKASPDSCRAVTCIVTAGLSVWLAVEDSAMLRLLHANSFEHLCDVNVAPVVSKMLANCDDIIRQDKLSCLRVTSLLACKDLLWVGTSAGVLLTVPLHVNTTTRLPTTPIVTGVPDGHIGQVRFLTVVEAAIPQADSPPSSRSFPQRDLAQRSLSQRVKPEMTSNPAHSSSSTDTSTCTRLLVVSGGEGYEYFGSSTGSVVAGKKDSTNRLLLWQV